MSAPSPISSLCPKCGNFAPTTYFDDFTGWCGTCSQPSTGASNKTEIAFAANANAIEFYLSNGSATTTWSALALARQDRAICVVCGVAIPHAPRNAVFCRRNAECRRYSRRYVYLYTERRLSKAQALAIIFDELT